MERFYHSVTLDVAEMGWLYQLYQKMSDRSNTRQRKETIYHAGTLH